MPEVRTEARSLRVEEISKSFQRGDGPKAVNNVSLSIEPGEIFFLLGPSGCGKTTLLRMIAGFIDPDAGRIFFGQRDVTHVAPEKRNTAMVFQSYALWPHMSVRDNVSFGLATRGIGSTDAKRLADQALDLVRMTPYANRRPNQLSGGQQQRVALARALVVSPDVLLLDEPLSNLDAKLRVDLRSEIRAACKGDGSRPATTAVYVTHDQKEALSIADRVAIMQSGEVVQVGAPRELYASPKTRFVAEFLGECNFIEGRVQSASTRELVIETPLARLLVAPRAQQPLPAPNQAVTVGVRPEWLRIATGEPGRLGENVTASRERQPDDNTLVGVLESSVYLGDVSQHVFLVGDGGVRLRLVELGHASATPPRPGERAVLTFSPQSAFVLS
ncbi:MAG: ABC transporter ATP-binding protein [Planctomycetota bacterium]|nr:ABC transporter ATP-binding protein [Planctomycetota bacterium]